MAPAGPCDLDLAPEDWGRKWEVGKMALVRRSKMVSIPEAASADKEWKGWV